MQLHPHLSIELCDIGKKFGNEWVFKKIDLKISQGEKVVVMGGNGSGKSTLLQIISGYVLPNQGKVNYNNGSEIDPDHFKDHISLASPYLELIEEFSFAELISHSGIYKPFLNNLGAKDIIELAELNHAGNKPLKTYSSGMKQRVKLTMAILADCEVLLLDEPVSNLDKAAIEWYKNMIAEYALKKSIIVCSNSINDEFAFCDRQIDLTNYKKS